jgi:hypothetical protein
LDVWGVVPKGNQEIIIYDDPVNYILPEDWVFPLKNCKVDDLFFKCPKQSYSILTDYYGNNLNPSNICINGEWKQIINVQTKTAKLLHATKD